jgi:hypothetical protein
MPASVLVAPAHTAEAAAKRLVHARTLAVTLREGKPVSGLN